MRHLSPFAVVLALAGFARAGELPDSWDPAAVPNYKLVRPGLATAGQPKPEVLAKLKEAGFRTIVNLRTEAEGAKDEEALVRAAGLDYVWVPVTPASFSLPDTRSVAAVLDDPARGPVLLHCSTSNRVGGVMAVIAALGGKRLGEAETEGRRAGLVSAAMIEAFRRVAAEAKPSPAP